MQPTPPLAPQPAAAAPRGGRPTSLTVGALLLVITTVLGLAETAVVTVGLVREIVHLENLYGADSAGPKSFKVGLIVVIAVNVVLAFGLMGSALSVLRGRPSGLVLAWVFGALTAPLRFSCGGTGGFLWFSDASVNGAQRAIPPWLYGADIALNTLALAAAIAAIVVLMRVRPHRRPPAA